MNPNVMSLSKKLLVLSLAVATAAPLCAMHGNCVFRDEVAVYDVVEVDADGAIRLYETARGVDDIAVLHEMLVHGADLNILHITGLTALHLAAKAGHAELVRALLEGGAAVDAATAEGITPLHEAARNGHIEAVRALLDGGAHTDIRDQLGFTAAKMARLRDHHAVALLIDLLYS